MIQDPPLTGLRIVEFAGVGPGPFCGMMLADHGAEVIRIDRPGGIQAGVPVDASRDVLLRSRQTISLDLKNPAGAEVAARLVASADGLIEGFRPGVMENLGFGPGPMLERNPRLVYGRMTGWGQHGALASRAGHDINYIAVSGVLSAIGNRGGRPVPPLNLVGDYGGGGLMLAFGMLAAMLAVKAGAAGRVVDCAMTEGSSALMAGMWTLVGTPWWEGGRGTGLLDGGAPFYDTYATADGRFIALGAIESRFFARLCTLLGLSGDPLFADQYDRGQWDGMRARLAEVFASQTQAHWCALLENEDVCFSAVMPLEEAPTHPQNRGRASFLEVDGVVQPAPAPRFGGTRETPPRMWRENSARDSLLVDLGLTFAERETLLRVGAFGASS